eukprot:1543547-Rhodomonas_salina.1
MDMEDGAYMVSPYAIFYAMSGTAVGVWYLPTLPPMRCPVLLYRIPLRHNMPTCYAPALTYHVWLYLPTLHAMRYPVLTTMPGSDSPYQPTRLLREVRY